jgi:hypothetical protein
MGVADHPHFAQRVTFIFYFILFLIFLIFL